MVYSCSLLSLFFHLRIISGGITHLRLRCLYSDLPIFDHKDTHYFVNSTTFTQKMHFRKPSFLKKASKGRAVNPYFFGLMLKYATFAKNLRRWAAREQIEAFFASYSLS